ncbi:mannose-1-phosphate guanylyltransferase [Halorientalis brevis]|uniref:Mannose-1-phosphate guanylyltransferase n=1 Tax=Halorientalis brevis TaxID=1126241 RepID=A0ABD6C9X8_9EURY|nr:sugar phosphate nucleotidyltransferase [Halorientalis brevis]
MDRPLVAVVLAGGTGTRLYPASRSDRPKQFLDFGGDQSLLADTVARAAFADEVYVLTRPAFADDVREHAPSAGVLTEPEPKDTGPALVYAAHRIREQVGDCVLCCLPSDHHVSGAFATTMETAAAAAVETGGLVTVGVEPTRAATGYGYVNPGERRNGYFTVDQFVEKPDSATAENYVEEGFYWNAGIFAWTPNALLSAARQTPLEPLVDALDAGRPEQGFDAVDPVSIDYAVLERTGRAYLVPAQFEWDDLGSWDAFERVLDADPEGNVVVGDGLLADSEDCVVATDGHVSAVGVSDLVIASYGDRTLVVPKADAQRVRDVVARLRDDDRF